MATAPQIESGGLKRYFEVHRTLETYPTGWYRWWMLLLTVFATIVSFYEFGLSSMLPLWMPSLHFTIKALQLVSHLVLSSCLDSPRWPEGRSPIVMAGSS